MNLANLTGAALRAEITRMKQAGLLIAVQCDATPFPVPTLPATKNAAKAAGAEQVAALLRDVQQKLPGLSDDCARIIVSLRDPALLDSGLHDPETGRLKTGITAVIERQGKLRECRAEVINLLTRKNAALSYEDAWAHAARLAPELFKFGGN